MKTLWTEWQRKCQGTVVVSRSEAGREERPHFKTVVATLGLQTFWHIGNQRSVQARLCRPSAGRHQRLQPAFEAQALQARRPSSLGVS